MSSNIFLKLENNNLNIYLEQDKLDFLQNLFISRDQEFKLVASYSWWEYFLNVNILNYLTSTVIEPISITSEFADKDEVNQINRNLSSLKEIDMTNQDTHSDISNNTITNTNDETPTKYRGKTNRKYIEEQVKKLIKEKFTVNNVDLWTTKYSHKMKYDIEFQPTAQRVKIFFKDLNPETEPYADRFLNQIPINVKLSFHRIFFQKQIQNRITITPSLILDPKTNQLVTDQPEVEVIREKGQTTGQIFWYHNTVRLEFRAIDHTEQLLVDSKPTEVYNNVYVKTLVDKRFLKSEDNTTQAKSIDDIKKGLIWNVAVNQKAEKTPIDIKIGIRSISPNLSFKWKGWDPVQDPTKPEQYHQWKLTNNFKDENKKDNLLYDPSIDKNTGTRKEIIWVSSPSRVNNFYQDPYDKNDNLNQVGKLANFGYIAEASVANSGASYMFDKNEPTDFNEIQSAVQDLNKSIGEIKLTKYSDNFTNPFSIPNTNQNSALQAFAVSQPGIYHYNIPIKDYVAQKDTFTPTKIQKENITSVEGSSLHKYLIINNSREKYQSFLQNYNQILNNNTSNKPIPRIQSFWSSPAGQHLKAFLLHNQLITDKDQLEPLVKRDGDKLVAIEPKYSYEQIVSLWNYYVSSVKQGTIVLPHGVARTKPLFDIKFNSIKIAAENKIDAITQIKKEALDQIQKQTNNNSITVNDFELVETGINWNRFLDIKTDNQDVFVTFKANPTSVYLSDISLSVRVLNSTNFKGKINNLSEMNFSNLNFNFKDFVKKNDETDQAQQERFVNNYITQHILKTINNHRQNNKETVKQNVDYEIYINDHKITQFTYTFGFENQQVIDNLVKEFFENVKTKHFTQLSIEIKSTETTFKLKGSNAYLITHSSNANIAPESPAPFNWPEEQNTPSNNSNPEILKYFDLLLSKLSDWIGDFSKWTIKDFEQEVINNITKQLTEQSKKPVELNKDFIILINDGIYSQRVIEDFFKSKGKLKITIQAIIEPINREKVLINSRDIFLHNTLDGKTPEQVTPTTPDSSDSNNNNENNSDNPSNQDKPNQGRKNTKTILAIVGGAIFAIGLGFAGIVRWRSRKLS